MSAEECVFCGVDAVRDEQGEILGWIVTAATDPDCDHELLTGEG